MIANMCLRVLQWVGDRVGQLQRCVLFLSDIAARLVLIRAHFEGPMGANTSVPLLMVGNTADTITPLIAYAHLPPLCFVESSTC